METGREAISGDAGASARREFERKRERRLATAPSGARGVLARLAGPSARDKRRVAEERAWAVGARGEQMLAEHLQGKCAAVPVLHDRRIPRSRANIDHIAVAPTGVYVIDAKRYRGKIKVSGRLLGTPRLLIAGRNRTKLIEGLERQVSVVEALVREIAPGVPVHGCLCFLDPEGIFGDSGLPLLRTLAIRGFPLYYPKRLTKRLNAAGPLSSEQALHIHGLLAEQLRPA